MLVRRRASGRHRAASCAHGRPAERRSTGPTGPSPGSAERLRAMAVRPIVITGEPVLHRAAALVEAFDDDLRTLVADMFETDGRRPRRRPRGAADRRRRCGLHLEDGQRGRRARAGPSSTRALASQDPAGAARPRRGDRGLPVGAGESFPLKRGRPGDVIGFDVDGERARRSRRPAGSRAACSTSTTTSTARSTSTGSTTKQAKKARKAVKRNGWGKPGNTWHAGRRPRPVRPRRRRTGERRASLTRTWARPARSSSDRAAPAGRRGRRPDRHRQVRPRPSPSPSGSAARSSTPTPCSSTAAWTSARPSCPLAERRGIRAPPARRPRRHARRPASRPTRSARGPTSPPSAAADHRRSSSAAPASTCARPSTGSRSRRPTRRSGARLEAECRGVGGDALHARLRDARPGGGRPRSCPATAAGSSGPSRSSSSPAGRSRRRCRPASTCGPTVVLGLERRPTGPRRADRPRASRRMWDARPASTRSRGPAAVGLRDGRTAVEGASATPRPSPQSTATLTDERGAGATPRRRPAGYARRQESWFRARPADRLARPRRRPTCWTGPSPAVRRRLGRMPAWPTAAVHQGPRHARTTSCSCPTSTAPRPLTTAEVRRSPTATPASAATA